MRQGLGRENPNKKEDINLKVSIKNLGGNFKLKCSSFLAGLPLEVESGSFSPKLSITTAVIGSVLKMQR